jgi:threonine dehydratase
MCNCQVIYRHSTSSYLICFIKINREEFIAIAILRLIELEKAVVEGAGAVGFAAILQGLLPELKGKRVAIPLCGGNIDTTVLGRVLERGLVHDKRMMKVWVTVPDRPADLCRLCASKGNRCVNSLFGNNYSYISNIQV